MDFKVKCVRVKEYPDYFTEGKIYDVVNGVIWSDNEKDFETWSDPACNNPGECRGKNFESLRKWFAKWYDFELVEENKVFTVNDLKTGMFGVMSDGDKFVVVNDHIVYQNDGYDLVSSFRDNLEGLCYKIDKVWTGIHSFRMLDRVIDGTRNYGTLVYDRERDTKPKKPLYNGKVVCIDRTSNYGLYTVGKIYQFKDGSLTGDNGREYPLYAKVDSFEEFLKHTSAKWIEIKE